MDVALPPGRRSYALWAGGRGVGATTRRSPLPARRLHRLTGRRGGCALSFFKIDRIHHFDIHYSIFVIRFFKVSFPIRLAVFLARGGAHMKLHGMTIRQLISDRYHRCLAREGGYPVFKRTFYDSINLQSSISNSPINRDLRFAPTGLSGLGFPCLRTSMINP